MHQNKNKCHKEDDLKINLTKIHLSNNYIYKFIFIYILVNIFIKMNKIDKKDKKEKKVKKEKNRSMTKVLKRKLR